MPALELYTTGNMEAAVCTFATSEASGYPKENLVDDNLDTYWKPTSTSTQQVIMDLGGTKTVSALLFFVKNYTAITAGTVDRYWSDNGTTWNFISGNPAMADSSTPIRISELGADYPHRYWKVHFSMLAQIPQIAGIWWGRVFDVATDAIVPQADGDRFFTQAQALPGGRFAVAGVNRKHVQNISRRYLVRAGGDYDTLRDAFRDSRGRRHLLIINEGTAQSDARVVRFSDDALPRQVVSHVTPYLYDIGLDFEGVPYIDDGDVY